MSIMMVLAIGKNGEIGIDNEMPWGLSQKSDLARFRKLTEGSAVIMGRHTHESILDALGKTLPGRASIVVSRQFNAIEGVITTDNIKDACDIASKHTGSTYIIGGASVFEQCIEHVDQIYLTVIENDFTADRYFNQELLSGFQLADKTSFEADELNKYPYRFEIWNRMD